MGTVCLNSLKSQGGIINIHNAEMLHLLKQHQALLVSLLILPSLLLLVTPSRKGEERADMEAALTRGETEYAPHARATAGLRRPSQEPNESPEARAEEEDDAP